MTATTTTPKKSQPEAQKHSGASRRKVITAGAWSVPAILLSVATPAHATSLTYLLSIASQAPTVLQGGSTNVTVTLRDSAGHATSGSLVTLSVSGQTGVTLSATSATTGAAGTVSVVLTAAANASLGGVTITAISTSLSATTTVTVLANAPALVPSGSTSRYPVGSTRNTPGLGWTDTTPLYALLLKDAAGNPLTGATVQLTLVGTKTTTASGATALVYDPDLAWGNGVQVFASQGMSFTTTINASGGLTKSWPIMSTYASVGLTYPGVTYSFLVRIKITYNGTVTTIDRPLSVERGIGSTVNLLG